MKAPSLFADATRACATSRWNRLLISALLLSVCACLSLRAQERGPDASAVETTVQRVDHLTAAVAKVEAQMEANQQVLAELQGQLAALRLTMATGKNDLPAGLGSAAVGSSQPVSASSLSSLEELQERQAIDESQIATHEQSKVETDSKYPVKITGLVLFNSFVNTRPVDIASSPAYVVRATAGDASTGFSIRQTVLGLDARGPHLMGATSHADVRVDFFANDADYSNAGSAALRLRTAHVGLNWQNTQAFVELDRTILEPNAPTSLLAVGQPELAWSGNLWTWNPQVGVSQQFALSHSLRLQAEAALIDVSDPRIPGSIYPAVSLTERSRWPGSEAHIALLSGNNNTGPQFGVGGYFSPHRTTDGNRFDAWAASMDLRLPLQRRFEFTANAYRGQALGGLGGGGYVDYYYSNIDRYVARALDDVGGWAQFKARAGQRIEMNTGYGIDNPFAKEVHSSLQGAAANAYHGLARNRSYFWNTIWSPSAYLSFSIEYRRLWSDYSNGPTYPGDVIGIGAGYKF